jgi:hypothetical protein
MSKHTKKDSRTKTAVKIALVALAVGGGATIGYAKHNPDLLSAQSAAPALSLSEAGITPAEQTVTLYKSPTCTCCAKWGDHLREAGFEVQQVVSDDVQKIMEERGVPMHLRSCHLGVMGDYVLVGHVPANLAVRLLKEKPAVTGIAVPGMPLGSPGMEAFGRTDRYDVTAFGPDGVEYVFESR